MASTKARNDWEAIHLDYISGMKVRDIGAKYNIDHAQITKKAKAKNWVHNGVGKVVNGVIEVIRKETDSDKIIDNSEEFRKLERMTANTGLTREDLKQDVYRKLVMQNTAFMANKDAYEVLSMYTEILKKNLKTSKDGLYVKSTGASIVYGSYADDLAKVIVPTISETNKALGLTTAQVAIQNNVGGGANNSNDVVISANVVDASRDYQDFIKSK